MFSLFMTTADLKKEIGKLVVLAEKKQQEFGGRALYHYNINVGSTEYKGETLQVSAIEQYLSSYPDSTRVVVSSLCFNLV